jgi:hypothetical protein
LLEGSKAVVILVVEVLLHDLVLLNFLAGQTIPETPAALCGEQPDTALRMANYGIYGSFGLT